MNADARNIRVILKYKHNFHLMKKVISFFLILVFSASVGISSVFAEKRTLIATAYYSPVKGQSYYLRGSYEADIKLNGKGTHGASGKAVYVGMIAAPKSYAFGTRIAIPGMGTGTVHDRGGAIVKAGERGHTYDRIDIWMGSGEQGLARALAWGKRTISAEVVEVQTGSLLTVQDRKIDSFKIASIPLSKLPKNGSGATSSGKLSSSGAIDMLIFTKSVDEKSPKTDITMLSRVFIGLGYLEGKPRESFNPDLRMAVANFQLESGIIVDQKDPNLGVFGKVTAKKLQDTWLGKH